MKFDSKILRGGGGGGEVSCRKRSQKSGSILQDGSRFLGMFWKGGKALSYYQINTVKHNLMDKYEKSLCVQKSTKCWLICDWELYQKLLFGQERAFFHHKQLSLVGIILLLSLRFDIPVDL